MTLKNSYHLVFLLYMVHVLDTQIINHCVTVAYSIDYSDIWMVNLA
jgi:hypothetical protein